MEVPRHLCPVFLLILAVYTCLPLPNVLSILFAILVTGFHIFALATYGRQDQAESREHYRKVRLPKYKVTPYAPSKCLMARGLSRERIEKMLQHNTEGSRLMLFLGPGKNSH